jgi:hypothetical protein
VFLFAAEGLADLVTEDDLAVGRVYPPLHKIRSVNGNIYKIHYLIDFQPNSV